MKLLLINVHGLIRDGELEIGRDADNGGQIVYIMELAKTLVKRDDIERVVLLTRRIEDSELDSDYANEIEVLGPKLEIRRVYAGPKDYLLKEQLWEHIDDFVTNAVNHIKRHGLDFDYIYGHYADGGYAANQLSLYMNKPFSFAGHSLGRPKLHNLIAGGMPAVEVEQRYHISERIEAEETAIANAEFTVTSTQFEVGYWQEYRNQSLTEFVIIPPGFNVDKFYPYQDITLELPHVTMEDKLAVQHVKDNIEKFLSNPQKPAILVVCRPTQTKNLEGVLNIYGNSKELQAMANLVIFSGIRENIETMPPVEKEVLTKILLLMDRYNLYGKIAIPKKHNADRDIPAAYRYCAHTKGVFMNAALMENFGLTSLEASACGLPVVVTNSGGPSEIVSNCNNGFACDPLDENAFQTALTQLLIDEDLWTRCSENGIVQVRENYTWERHCERLVERIQLNLTASTGLGVKLGGRKRAMFDRLGKVKRMFVTDIDGTLIAPKSGNQGLKKLCEILKNRNNDFAFVIATGRNLPLVHQVLKEYDIPEPDIIVASVGSQVYYGAHPAIPDQGYQDFIDNQWDRSEIEANILKLPFLKKQPEKDQNPHKISFICQSKEAYRSPEVESVLGDLVNTVNIIWSHDMFLDILPRRASKGRAMRYLAFKWDIQLGDSLSAGDSGNDLDLFTGNSEGIVVGDHAVEMEDLRGKPRVYFSDAPGPAGILEGFSHFDFLNRK